MKETEVDQHGHYHPITLAIRRIEEIFRSIGFSVAHGPQIETEANNFDALNIPATHPARDLWDTFWLKDNALGELLRTHTSPVQIRYMREHEAPIKIIAPGKVFRYEATDATHEAQFYQLEGLWIDKDVTLGNLKGVLEYFFSEFFGEKMEVRLRPSFFPFVEPGLEVDMRKSAGMGGAKQNNPWIEIMGAGMVHPNVLENVGLDPGVWRGFAFGAGVDRLAMLKLGVPDVRMFYQGDLRLVEQF